jgi:MHS family proline/betaine transporter-like MFS transporter
MTNSRLPQKTMSRASIAVAAFSTVVEWYDFTLYLYLATVLSRVFFGPGGAALTTTLATFAIAYLLRPLGGVFFGHIGDRFGRRRTMLLSVALMTMTMLGTALLPTYAEAGAAAGWLLFVLRCVMGFSVGGEYNAVVAYLLEGAPRTRRGLVASMASASSEVGGLFAVGVCLLTVSSMSSASLDAWGWRIPFVVGALLAGERGDRPHDDAGVAGVRTAAGKRHGAQASVAGRAHQTSPRYSAGLRDLRLGIDHLLCRDHLRARVPGFRRKAQ